MITVQVDTAPITAALNSIHEDQVPFAASLALNNTAKGAQAAIREGIQQRFTIRRDWVLEQIKIPKFSTKRDDPMSVMITTTQPGDFLDKFEAGGTKKPRLGVNVAVPIMARPSRGQIVPDNLRPKRLNLHEQGHRIVGDQRTFLIELRNGKRGIFQRVGPGRDGIRLLYWLTPSVPIPASLRMVRTAVDVVDELWAINFEEARERAVSTAKPR